MTYVRQHFKHAFIAKVFKIREAYRRYTYSNFYYFPYVRGVIDK